jgi:hypothetical protein
MQRYTGAGHNAGFGGGVPGRGVVARGREKGRLEPSSFHGANYPANLRWLLFFFPSQVVLFPMHSAL